MRRAPSSLLALATFAAVSIAIPAGAQSLGGASNSVGSSGTGGSSIGGSGTTGGGVTPSLGGAANAVGSSGGVGSSATSTQQRATAGSTTLNPINADAAARTGNVGAASTIGSDGTLGSSGSNGTGYGQAGAGPASLYNIPRPRVNVDLGAIRSALRMGPNATPDSRGN
ncbi:hypothetical protein [Aureimonas sp. Leaf324]|jgi:hypothetical protein|uniref:hypothetical protein n=1 Tax=Aureimonas sp. Leaf324 TaxID=1736336 RepID=UPI0006FF757D|nr:hypothetical protein [Aureimonas sp. Leaf324]KQQ88727.1 hypothetical protein ASF65_18105 [Aureimonas sp. Leaf324]